MSFLRGLFRQERIEQSLVFACSQQTPLDSSDWDFGPIYLERRLSCPTCQSPVFEVALCRECGAEYLAAEELLGTGKNVLSARDFDPDEDEYFVNAHGLRGPWPAVERRPNELRIVCIGDSCSFGSGVRLDQAYGHRLEYRLQEALPGRIVSTTLLDSC